MLAAGLQFDVRRADARDEGLEGNLREVEHGLRAAAQRGVRLVVLPEMWATSFLPLASIDADVHAATARALERLAQLSGELSLCVAGSAYGPGEQPTNRLHVFDRGAEVLAYDKVHLFTPTAEGESFRAGELPPGTVDTSAGRLSGVVCYDLRFPEVTRVPFRAGAQLLVVPAQWPVPRLAHWRRLLVARAIENQCYVLGANRTGSDVIGRRKLQLDFPGASLLVSPLGEVLAEGGPEAGLVTAELDLDEVRRYRTRIPVAKDERVDLYRRWLED